MTRTIAISILVVVGISAWQSLAVWSMLDTCSARARAIVAAADPMDREPPSALADVIAANMPLDQLFDYLATILLDRYQCRSTWSGTDWLIDKPLLARRLDVTFDKSEIIALFAATADMGKGDVGLSRGARRLYHKELSALADQELSCLIRRSLGRPLHQPVGARVPPFWICPGEPGLVRPSAYPRA